MIAKRKRRWIELHLGPIHFRAMWDQGKYLPGTPLDQMVSWFQHSSAGALSIDEATGAIVIQWNFLRDDGRREQCVERHYGDSSHRFQLQQIDDRRTKPLSEPIGYSAAWSHDARNLFCGAASLRNRLTQEFYYAVDAGLCEVFARVGSPLAPFTHIPADVFRRYRIKGWGAGVVGGGIAILDDEPTLYAIHLRAATAVDQGSKQAKRSATPNDIAAFRSSLANGPVGIKELDKWRRDNAPEISRDSLRALFKSTNPELKRGPRGPRQKTAE